MYLECHKLRLEWKSKMSHEEVTNFSISNLLEKTLTSHAESKNRINIKASCFKDISLKTSLHCTHMKWTNFWCYFLFSWQNSLSWLVNGSDATEGLRVMDIENVSCKRDNRANPTSDAKNDNIRYDHWKKDLFTLTTCKVLGDLVPKRWQWPLRSNAYGNPPSGMDTTTPSLTDQWPHLLNQIKYGPSYICERDR